MDQCQGDPGCRPVHVVEQVERVGQDDDPGHSPGVIDAPAQQARPADTSACTPTATRADAHPHSTMTRRAGLSGRRSSVRPRPQTMAAVSDDRQHLPACRWRRYCERAHGAAGDRHAPEIGGGAGM